MSGAPDPLSSDRAASPAAIAATSALSPGTVRDPSRMRSSRLTNDSERDVTVIPDLRRWLRVHRVDKVETVLGLLHGRPDRLA